MKLIAYGTDVPAEVIQENGQYIGYGDLLAILDMKNVPYRIGAGHQLMVGLRALADAFQQPAGYDQSTNTYHLGDLPATVTAPAVAPGANIPPWLPVTAPITSDADHRSPDLLLQVIRQFRVATNPRYTPRDKKTYCNIFASDVTEALRAEIPHNVNDDGSPAPFGAPAHEQDADMTVAWLRQYGPAYGWVPTDAHGALAIANQGSPAVACWLNEGGDGHIAVVRPGEADPDRGIPIAQAGGRNFDDGYLVDGFGTAAATRAEFYVHA